MAEPPLPTGRLLLTGPTGSGKTRRTAELLRGWVDAKGPQDVVVLEFAPEHERADGQVLGRRLERFTEIPDEVLYLLVETRAPRASRQTAEKAIEVAQGNAPACQRAIEEIPEPVAALFINDATMAYHVPGSDPAPLLARIRTAGVAVVNALDPEGFETEHPITKQERRVLAQIEDAVDRTQRLPTPTQQRPR